MKCEAHKGEKKIALTMHPTPSLSVRTKWDASPTCVDFSGSAKSPFCCRLHYRLGRAPSGGLNLAMDLAIGWAYQLHMDVVDAS